MLFPRNALPSGPQAYFFAEKKGTKVNGGKVIDWDADERG